MPTEQKVVLPKFPLRLMPSIRQDAEAYSAKEGVSLNQFINVAVAERLAHLQHQEWAAQRRKPTLAERKSVLALLDIAGTEEPGPDDQIPSEYLAIRAKIWA